MIPRTNGVSFTKRDVAPEPELWFLGRCVRTRVCARGRSQTICL